MSHQFSRHYTLDEARALLPQVRHWLEQMEQLRQRLAQFDERTAGMHSGGEDLGGRAVNQWVATIADFKTVVAEFESREIQIKDLDRGLVDFPSLRNGKEVFLCWEKDEQDIEYWHELHTGYSAREHL